MSPGDFRWNYVGIRQLDHLHDLQSRVIGREQRRNADIRLRFQKWLKTEVKRSGGMRKLSRSSGVDHSTISRLLNQDREPLLTTIVRLGYMREPR